MPEIARAFCWGIGIFLAGAVIIGIVGTIATIWFISGSNKRKLLAEIKRLKEG